MIQSVLIANRGAIAVRIERTLKDLGIKSIGVYSKADRDSLHVENADIKVFLGEGGAKETYLDRDKIIEAAIQTKAEAIHPGYGFLSEDAEFAKMCQEKGIIFIGPDAEHIRLFGLKHSARELAIKAQVPLLEGTNLLSSLEEALTEGRKIGYPIILKSTAGGGGIGMRICHSEKELEEVYENVQHLAASNFHNSGVFLEKYLEKSRHVEIQIFGNAFHEIVSLGDRDCSTQRRNQKVVEESPAPNIPEQVRQKMSQAALRLAKEVNYKSAGTVEFLYDDASQNFYFLEVNTRLQVEHGITEEVMKIDLVEWMVKEASNELVNLQDKLQKPQGHAIEVRIYAEDCLNNFRPSTGKLDQVDFDKEARIETWIRKGLEVTSLYDPMLAKLIVHGSTRQEALKAMSKVLEESRVYGITTNIQYLQALLDKEDFVKGDLHTGILKDFQPEEYAIEVLDGGIQSTIQDYPGMVGYWYVGVPPCGPMDNYSFRLGNSLLDNKEDAPGIEMTLRGGSYKFRTAMSFCLTGADMKATLDQEPIGNYQVIQAKAGQVLRLKECKVGMRTYLLVAGGFDLPKIMGSSSTFVDGKFGGHGGRSLRAGDVIRVYRNCVLTESKTMTSLDQSYQPDISKVWTIGVLPGPQPTGEYLKKEYLQTLTSTEYVVNFNSARTGVRLNGPTPQWEREDGGEAGLHPSNIHDNAYAIGTLDLTGDQSILLGPDGPSLGGFVCPVTTAKAELWKLGQLHPGDKVHFQLLTLEEADRLKEIQGQNLKKNYQQICLDSSPSLISPDYAILEKDIVEDTEMIIRLDGQENILVEYGDMELNIALRFRVHVLAQELEKTSLPIIDLTPGIRSLQIHFDDEEIGAREIASKVVEINKNLPDLMNISLPSRIVKLPLSWDDPQTQLAARRYQETVREDAPWCPSNPEFIRRVNGLKEIKDVENIVFEADYLVLGLGDVYLGAPVATPIDPRHRLITTKYNPARPWTPENAVGIGGAYLCVYGMEGPGGYQFVGRTIQMWNPLKSTKFFPQGKPWLLNFFDRIQFYPVSADEILKAREDFIRGDYEIDIQETSFNFADFKKFLASIEDSTKIFKERQVAAFMEERQRWKEEGLDQFVSIEEEPSAFVEEQIEPGHEGVRAGIPGKVWKVLVKEGDHVEEGDTLAILESMKMEFPVQTDYTGTISKLYVEHGQASDSGQLIATIKIGE